jgi:hypothetical protein
MLLEYQSMVNFVAKGSDGSISGKVSPSDISQAMKSMRISKPTKVELVALILSFMTVFL